MKTQRIVSCLPRASALIALWMVSSLGLAACGTPTETPVPIQLRLVADRSALPLATDLAEAYHTAYPHISIDVEPMGNSQAVIAAMVERRDELALATALPFESDADALHAQVVAYDPVALITHPENPLDGVDAIQAAAILHGDLRDWGQLGSAPAAIQVYTREHAAGPRATLDRSLLDGQTLTPMAIVVPNDAEVVTSVANDRSGFGYAPLNWLDGRVKALAIAGIPPEAGVSQIDYPLMMPIVLLSSDMPSANTVDFLRFVQGNEGQQTIAKRYVLAEEQ